MRSWGFTPPTAWVCCRQEGAGPFSPSFSCQVISLSTILVAEHLCLWGGVRERGPSPRAHLDKSTWSLSLTGVQGVQPGASAFILGGTPVPVADQSLLFLQQRSVNLYSRCSFLGPRKSSHTFSFSSLWALFLSSMLTFSSGRSRSGLKNTCIIFALQARGDCSLHSAAASAIR